jgi:hypothetical protein
MSRALSLCLVALGLGGCITPVNPSQRLAESAYDMNTATRFGRMDVALEHVGSQEKDAFARRHSAWGRSVRIVDLELGGMSFKKKNTEAEVLVTITWQKIDEADVRVTSLTQRWADLRGTWSLLAEEEKGGDAGLLAEAAAKSAEAPALARPRYRTRVIQAVEE